MDIKTIEKIINNSGKFCSISWKRNCKVYKNVSDKIEKETKGINLRVGCSYDNLKSVKADRENGVLPSENQGLIGYEWVKYPYILKSIHNDKLYLRVECANNSKFDSRYFENGKEVNKDEILDKLCANEKSKSNSTFSVFNISLDSIVSFN